MQALFEDMFEDMSKHCLEIARSPDNSKIEDMSKICPSPDNSKTKRELTIFGHPKTNHPKQSTFGT